MAGLPALPHPASSPYGQLRDELRIDAVEFAVAESTNRSFEEVCASLRDAPGSTLHGFGTTRLRVDADPLVSIGPQVAVVRARWRDSSGLNRLHAQIRVVGVNRGAEPITELLMIGHGMADHEDRSAVLSWAREVLTALADRPRQAA